MRSPIAITSSGTSNTSTAYLSLSISTVFNGTQTAVAIAMPVACTISELCCQITPAPGSGKSRAYTLMKNGSATSLTCTISDTGTVASDLSNSVSFAAGDTVSLRMVPTGTPTAETSGWFSVVAEATGQPIIANSGVSTASLQYASIQGRSTGSTENRISGIVPCAGTISNLYAHVNTAPGGAASKIYTLYLNGSASALTCTISGANTSASDTSNSVSVAAGDRISIQQDVASAPAASISRDSMLFTPTVDGDSMLLYGNDDNPTATATEYSGIMPPGNTWQATESVNFQLRHILGATWRMKKFYGRSSAASGAAKSWDLTVRKNAVSTALTVNLANTTTAQSVTADVDVVPGDYLGQMVTGNSTPAAARMNSGVLLNPTFWRLAQPPVINNAGPGTITLDHATAVSSLIVVKITSFSAAIPSGDVTDNKSNTYTRTAPGSINNTGDDDCAIFYSVITSGGTGHQITNVTGSSMTVEVWTCDGGTPAIDTTNSATGSATASTLSITPSTANSLIVAVQADDQNAVAYTSRTGFTTGSTELDTSTHERLGSQFMIDAPASAQTVGFTSPSAGLWALNAAVFKIEPPSAGGSNQALSIVGVG